MNEIKKINLFTFNDEIANIIYHKLILIYPNIKFENINKPNIIKRMELLNKTLLLEHSARISLNPKRIQRLLNSNEIDFLDGSFDTLTS